MNAFVKIILATTFVTLNSNLLLASEMNESDRFQAGVKAFQSSDYLNCAIKMESLKDGLSKMPEDTQSKILFYRAICNGKIGYYAYTLPLIKQVKSSYLTDAQADTLVHFEKDMQSEVFKIGLGLSQKKDFAGCATQLELLKEPSSLWSDEWKNRFMLYRAHCNAQLGYKVFAANLVDEIEDDHFSPNENEILAHLKNSLRTELEAKNKLATYLTLYGGAISYSPQVAKSKASLYGVSTFITPVKGGWDLAATYEKMKLTLIPTTTSYDQTQVNIALGKSFLTDYSVHAFFTNISTSNADSATGGNKGSVIGAAGSYINSPTSKLTLEIDHSAYPVLSIGKTTVNEYALSWDKTLLAESTYSIASKLTFESVHPTAPVMIDSTGFILKTHYERYALDLNLYFASFQFGVSGWTGSEALGVRNQGGLVFNSLEERTSGIGANVNFIITTAAAVKVSYSSEKAKNSTTTTTSSTSVAALTFNF